MKREDVIDRRWYRADGRAAPRRTLVNIASINSVAIGMSSRVDLYGLLGNVWAAVRAIMILMMAM